MWNQLPELILTQIFSYLNRADRAAVGQICNVWYDALSTPKLWRSMTIFFDRDLCGELSLPIKLLEKYGQHMRTLELAWSRPYLYPKHLRIPRNIQAEAGAEFLNAARAKDVQLKKLILTDWTFNRFWGNRGMLLFALANFASCQHNLEYLHLFNANLCVSEVLRLLGTVARASSDHLAFLDLRGAFREWQTPHNNPRYLKVLGHFRALNTLKLDYPALSDQVLNALANAAPKVLSMLYISIRDSDSRHHNIADLTWRNLVLACPSLMVSYTIVNISHYEDIKFFLLPSVPLVQFQMFSGHVWDQSRSRNFQSTVGLLISHYTETLAEVVLQLRNNRELLDDLLLTMLTKCSKLKKLQYDGIIGNFDTVREICRLQSDCKISFQTIHVKPKNVSDQNRCVLDKIVYQYDKKLLKQGVDFRIENSTSVLMFY